MTLVAARDSWRYKFDGPTSRRQKMPQPSPLRSSGRFWNTASKREAARNGGVRAIRKMSRDLQHFSIPKSTRAAFTLIRRLLGFLSRVATLMECNLDFCVASLCADRVV